MKRTLMILSLAYSIVGQGQLKKMYDMEAFYGHFNGIAKVASGDSVLLNECYGTADESQRIESDTRLDVGSITKQFTAAAILHLVQNGAFGLNDPINPLLGAYASDRWKRVTVHQLLTHTSGIPSIYQTEQGLDIFFPNKDEILLADLIKKFSDGKLLFSPGEEFSYSNSGYVLLAAIIEQVSKQAYEEYMMNMFSKYNLKNTSFERDSKSAKPYYGYRDDLIKPAPINHKSWFIGAGGVYSSVDDLSKWIKVITSEDFLSGKLRDSYLRSHTNAGYGYGWQFDGDHIQHDGGNAGFISFLSFNPTNGAYVIALTNRSFEDIKMFGKSANYIRELVEKSWGAMSQKEIEILPEIVSGRDLKTGTFNLGRIEVKLMDNDSTLLVTAQNTFPSRLIYNTPLPGKDEGEKKMIAIAKYMEKGKYWSLAKHADGEMKFVMYSGLMSVGMRMMKKQVGKMEAITPYFVDESSGVVRMKGNEGILDLIVYFDQEGKIQGVFEHGFHSVDKDVSMIAYPIGKNLYYLDGLPYGEKSATLKVTDSTLTIYQLNRSVVANRK